MKRSRLELIENSQSEVECTGSPVPLQLLFGVLRLAAESQLLFGVLRLAADSWNMSKLMDSTWETPVCRDAEKVGSQSLRSQTKMSSRDSPEITGPRSKSPYTSITPRPHRSSRCSISHRKMYRIPEGWTVRSTPPPSR
jgi:hypothetical protein